MQKQNDLAINLMNLFEPSSYKEFGEGYFVNRPKMKGHYYIFKKITKPKFCLIINESEHKYETSMSKIRDYVFIVFNVTSFDEYIQNLPNNYFPQLMDILDNEVERKNTRNLPYGYYLDENGNLRVDIKKAGEVRKVYDIYIELGSVREVAERLKTDFSHIREILHSNEEYQQMTEKIVPLSKIQKVREIMSGNVRGGAIAKRTLQDEIEEVRRLRKNKVKEMKQPH